MQLPQGIELPNELEDITETIRASLKLMVDDLEHVEVKCLQIAGVACLCIEGPSADLGKIIGKQGKMLEL
jgi:predicted RNA-binding protein YlqC (UPF0109 family)